MRELCARGARTKVNGGTVLTAGALLYGVQLDGQLGTAAGAVTVCSCGVQLWESALSQSLSILLPHHLVPGATMRRLAVLSAVAAALWSGGAAPIDADGGSGPSADRRTRYRSYVASKADELLLGMSLNDTDRHSALHLIEANHAHDVLGMALVQAKLWEWGGCSNSSLAERSSSLLLVYVRDWIQDTGNGTKRYQRGGDFFASYPLVASWELLRSNGWGFHGWSAHELSSFPRVALECASPWSLMVNNQAFARSCGTALAAQLFAADWEPGVAEKWQAYLAQLWGIFQRSRDTVEQGLAYNGIWLSHAFLFAEITSQAHPERMDLLLQSPDVRKVYERFLHQVPPSGVMAAVGDDGEPTGPLRSIDSWPAIFEKLGVVTNESEFLLAADRIFANETATEERLKYPFGHLAGGQTLSQLARGGDWALGPSVAPNARASRLGSFIGKRRGLSDQPQTYNMTVEDMLVLKDKKGSAFIQTDVYLGVQHAHVTQAGAIVRFEHEKVIFLQNLGYHNRCPEHANHLIMSPNASDFPFQTYRIVPGRWHKSTLPTKRFRYTAPSEDKPGWHLRNLSSLNFRLSIDVHDQQTWIEVDDIRLTGPAGEILIDDFEHRPPKPWCASRGVACSNWTTDSHSGSHAMKLWPPNQASSSCCFDRPADAAPFPLVFDSREYDTLEVVWRFSSNTPGSWFESAGPPTGLQGGTNRGLEIGDHDGSPFGFTTCDEFAPWPNHPSTIATTADGRDSFMSFEMGGWYTRGTNWTRNAVLLHEGALVVLDTLVASERASGYVAGPVWHLVVAEEPLQGTSDENQPWYNAFGFTDTSEPVPHINNASQMLVMMASSRGEQAEQGVSSRMLWGNVKPWSLFTKVSVEPGAPVHFLSVLQPHRQSADTVARATKIQYLYESSQGGAFSVHLAQGTVSVSIAANGSWGVVRNSTI